MDLESAQNNNVAKLPLLKQGDYEMCKLRIEQYFQVQDYALWDVIGNGNSFKPVPRTTSNADGTSTSTIPGPLTTEDKAQKKNDVKARSMLLMALPNKYLLTFSQYKDTKTLFEAIQVRFDVNDATKKTQKTLLKQMYENFNAPSTESINSIFNRLQKIRNKADLDTMSIHDLFNNFKIVEQEVKRTVTSSSSLGSQNMTFISSPGSTNEVDTTNIQISTVSTPVSTVSSHDNTANLSDATVYAFLANQPNGSQLVREDLEQIHKDDLEEMDLKWQLAFLSMRARRYFQRTGKKITISGSDTAGYDKTKVECFNCHKMGYFARECKSPRNKKSMPRNQDSSRKTMNVEDTSSKAMVAIDGAGFDWSYMADDEVPTNMALMAFSDSESLDKLIGSEIFNNSRQGVGFTSYNAVAPLPTCLFTPPTVDLSNSGLEEFQHPEFKGYGPKDSKSVCVDTSNEIKKAPDAPIIEDWVSDSDDAESEEPSPISQIIKNMMEDLLHLQAVQKEKGKQHKASCKSKLVNSVSQPLQILHINLFGPTFIKRIMGKMYCLVVTDDYSGFSWVFFLSKKDETSRILKDFITGIENQLNHKVKILKYDNRTEFKNYEMNQFCGIKGIKREFNVSSSHEEVESSPKDDAGKKSTVKPPCVEGGKTDDLGILDHQMKNTEDSKNTTSTNSFNTASLTVNVASNKDGTFQRTNDEWDFSTPITVNDVGFSFNHPAALHDYSKMPNLEDTGIFDNAHDDRDEGAEADYNNLETEILVVLFPPLEFTRIILKNKSLENVKSASTPMETHKPLSKDTNGIDVDAHLYRSMIGTLMYLTSSRPDIMFVVCACSRFQVQPKVSHMHVVKRIFRYLKGQPTLGHWYPTDVPLELIAYSDSDYAGASLDRKSTIGGCHFFGSRLIFWQCKKQTIVANSTTKAEYITASNCCGQAVVISESSVRSDLLFDDEDGIICLTNDEIFENLALMGYETLSTKLTFQKGNGSLRRQETMGGTSAQTRSERVLEQPNESPLTEGHTSGSREGSMEHIVELTDTVPPTPYDSPLTGGYTPRSDEGRLKLNKLMDFCTTLSNRVSTLENKLSSTKAVYHKAFITLTKRVKKLQTQLKQKRSRAVIHSSDEEEPNVDIKDSPKQGIMIKEIDKDEDVNLVSAQGEVQETAEPLKDDDNDATLVETLLNIKRSTSKDKGKGIMQETELPKKIKKREMVQLSLDEELAQKLYAKELAKEAARQEQERPFSKAEVRKNIVMYLKNQGGYKQSYFKRMKYEDIRPIFKRVWDKIHNFVPKDYEIEKEVMKRSGFHLQQESSKKQKLNQQTEEKEEEVEAQADSDQEVKETKLYMKIVPDEDIAIDAIPLATKPSAIVEYKIVKEGKISTYHIIRADGSTKRYTSMIKLLENIDREDLETIWKLVKDKYGNTRPEEDYERVLWGDLKVMFEPDIESEVWRQLRGYDVTIWKLFSSSGVHFVRFKNLHIYMLVDKAYPLTPAIITNMLERKYKLISGMRCVISSSSLC
nr:uncharacterized mitochondrial protein AtMg00810-like [Tanacetum cinerariifolium]